MPQPKPSSNDLNNHLAYIEDHLKDIRQDVSEILRSLKDELSAFREREFWRDYSDNYHHE